MTPRETTIPAQTRWCDRRLPNGLRVILSVDNSTPTVAVAVGYHVGGKNDPDGCSGFAHLFEHLMFKGTERTAAETIDHLTEDVGGFNNAYTTADHTVYYEVVPSNYLELLLWIEADRLAGLKIDEANFTTEREVVIGEYDHRILADPYGLVGELIERQMFAGHPYAQGVIGDPESLRRASLDDIARFHATYYRPDNAVLVVVGDFDIEQTTEWIDRYFAPLAQPMQVLPRIALPPPLPQPVERIVHRGAAVPLAALNLAYRVPPAGDAMGPAIDLIEYILGVGKSSRLSRALVFDRHLAAQYACAADLREQAGLFQLRAILHNEASLVEAEQVIAAELGRLCDSLVSESELTRAHRQLASHLVRDHETANDRALVIVSDTMLRGDPQASQHDLARYEAITAEEIRHVAQHLFAAEPGVLEYRRLT